MQIKICGIRREEDIEIVNEFLPDFIGFILVPNSKRYIDPTSIIKLKNKLNPKIKTVGVFVNETSEKINEIKKICGLDIIQLHGEETPDFCKEIDGTIWKVIGVENNRCKASLLEYSKVTDLLLLDSHVGNERGGTGITFNWELLNEFSDKFNIGVAGGININNIDLAKKLKNIKLIDLASGSETNNIKDRKKIEYIVKTIREGI